MASLVAGIPNVLSQAMAIILLTPLEEFQQVCEKNRFSRSVGHDQGSGMS